MKYRINYMCPITKVGATKTIEATSKAEARKKFNAMFFNPYPIVSITEVKE